MNTNAFSAAGGTLISRSPAAIHALLVGKNLAGWKIECDERDSLSYAHGFLMTHGTNARITLSASLPEADKLLGLRFLLNRLEQLPLHTTDTVLWHVGDEQPLEDRSYATIRILDTTLRNGAEIPGVTLSLRQKLELARQIALLHVDILEAGYPERSPADAIAVRQIAEAVGTDDGPIVAALAKAKEHSIDAAWNALEPAARRRIHVFLSTSDIHIERQMQTTRDEVLRRTEQMVRYARARCEDVQFTAMDATRSDPVFLCEVLSAALTAGATTLNIPDTVGYRTPNEYGALIAQIRQRVPGIAAVTLSAHCHNDMGMAVANSLAGVQAGAYQVECTVNGIGERAGNTPLEEVVMALHTRRDLYGATTGINLTELARASRLVRDLTDIPLPIHKPIVGEGASMHKEGIHREGVARDPLTFQIIRPDLVGLEHTLPLLDSQSTYRDFRKRLGELGYTLDRDQASFFFVQFKELAARKKLVSDREIRALLDAAARRPAEIYRLDQLSVHCGLNTEPSASVRLSDERGKAHLGQAFGTGPIDAAYKAINSIVLQPNELTKFTINAITEGVDSAAEVAVRVRVINQGNSSGADPDQEQDYYEGYGVHPDTVVAASIAYMNVLNRILLMRRASGAESFVEEVETPTPTASRPPREGTKPWERPGNN